MSAFKTTSYLLPLIESWQEGDRQAGEQLFAYVRARLVFTSRRLVGRDDRVLKAYEVDDVVQQALQRFVGASRQVQVEGARHFLAIANQHLRWAILDLAKKAGRIADDLCGGNAAEGLIGALVDRADTPASASAWHEVIARIQKLPEDEREVFELLYFHEMTQEEVAELLETSLSTVKRRWLNARERLGRDFRD